MKKRLTVLAAILLVLLVWAGCACAGKGKTEDLEISVAFSEVEVRAGDSVRVKISLTNISGKDFAEGMKLYDPAGLRIRRFGEPVLKNGETVTWTGRWTILQKNIEEAKVTYIVEFGVENADGEIMKKRVNLRQSITPLEPEPTPEPGPEDFDDVVLYGVYRPNPGTGTVAVGCVDSGGNVWLAEQADVPWPAADEDIRDMLRIRRGMKKHSNLIGDEADGTLMNGAWFSTDVPGMLAAVPQPEEKPRKTGIDVGQEGVWGLRKNENGEEESVLLGMAGSYVYENPSPDAQRLYLFMWRLLVNDEVFNARGFGYAAEDVSPAGFRGIPVREFYGFAEGDLSRSSVRAVWEDAEDGPEEKELTPEETEELRALAERGMVIRRENAWIMPEDTLTCTFTDEQGKELGRIRLFTYTVDTDDEEEELMLRTLAAADDGMYRTVICPRPVDTLTEEELRMMTVRIEGVDYTVGKSTPRDLISHGWNCFPEWTGIFTFEDPERENIINAGTRGDSLDEPITYLSCQSACDADILYCRFDGIIDENDPDDPDRGSFTAGPAEGPDPGSEEEHSASSSAPQRQWSALTAWIYGVIGADQDASPEEGTSVCVPLSDGRYLYLYSGDSPVNISLSEYGPDENTW